MDTNKGRLVEETLDELHNQKINNLSSRLDALQEQNKNAELWHKIGKGFQAVRNSSIGALALGTFGMMAVLAYGPAVNNTGFTADLAPHLTTALSVAYAGVAGFIATHLGAKNAEYKTFIKSCDVEDERKKLMVAAQGANDSLNEHAVKYGVSHETKEKMDKLYNDIFSNKTKSPLVRDQDEYFEKRARKNGIAKI